MKRTTLLLAAGFLAATSLMAGGASAETTLKVLSCYPSNSPQHGDYQLYLDMVNEAGKGVLQLQSVGGPEAMPATESGTALANGLIDVLFCPPAYYAGRFPDAWAFAAKLLPSAEVRQRGGAELYDKALKEKMNARFVAFADGGQGLTVYSAKEIKLRDDGLPDLTGHRLRTAITYTPIFTELGATPVTMPAGEVYTALERGLIDGTGYNILGADLFGWDKFLKYVVVPAFQKGSTIVTVNADKYESLSDAEKAVLSDTAPKYEGELEKRSAGMEQESLDKYRKHGMTVVELSEEAGKKIQDMWLDEFWKVVESTQGITADLPAVRQAFAGR